MNTPQARDRRRTVNAMLVLAAFAAERGLEPEGLLAGSGLVVANLGDSALTISFEQEFRCLRNLLRFCGGTGTGTGTGLGLEVGARYRITTLASVGFAQISSPTLRDALEVTLRYADLNVSMVSLRLADCGEGLAIHYNDGELPADLRQFAIERSMAVALTIARDLLGREVVPAVVDFSFRHPDNAGRYAALLGVMPRFGQPESILVLGRADVEASLGNSNPLALSMAEEQCRQWVARWKQRSGLAAQVSSLLASDPGARPAMAQVASCLHLSERTLRRKLQLEHTSFQQLGDEVREAVAEQLLQMPRLSIDQIAVRLGYAESASFIHAFKRWTGHTPQAYRLAQSALRHHGA